MQNHRQVLVNYLKTAQLFGEEFLPAPVSPLNEGTLFNRKTALDQLYKKYADCRRCPLCQTRKKIVFGMGSLQPRVLFIGEGPGYEEDRTGLPFVGKAGELLDKIFKAMGLSRDAVYITNIVKCHPLRDPSQPERRGNDRPPNFLEIESCREILEAQIEILNPPLLCALGNTAAKTLLKTEQGITQLRGQIHSFAFPQSEKTVPLIATYHPAALLRNESLKKDVWQDMKMVMKLLSQNQGEIN